MTASGQPGGAEGERRDREHRAEVGHDERPRLSGDDVRLSEELSPEGGHELVLRGLEPLVQTVEPLLQHLEPPVDQLEPLVEQANISFNHKAGTLRGFHYQLEPNAETKFIRCYRGAIWDVIVDLRVAELEEMLR